MQKISSNKINEFEKLSKPLIEFLNDNFNPHTKILITDDNAEILSGECSIHTKEFIKD
jgi:hypothetical protein